LVFGGFAFLPVSLWRLFLIKLSLSLSLSLVRPGRRLPVQGLSVGSSFIMFVNL